MKPVRLIFADSHSLEPFIVRSHQFSSRAASLANVWPGPVDLWLPGPAVERQWLQNRIAMPLPRTFELRTGPALRRKIGWFSFSSKFWFRRWLAKSVRQLAAEKESCVFYFRTLKVAHGAIPVLRARFPYVFEPHEVFYENGRKPEALKKIEMAVYNSAAHLFPISHSLRDNLLSKLAPAAQMTVSPLGHSGANFHLPPYDPLAPPRFLYIGSLHGWKGLETAFSATRDLGVPFDIVGDAGGLDQHRRRCEEAGYRHIIFHGTVPPDQLAQFYSPGSICLLPLSNTQIAKHYTSPLKLFEYMAAGRPIVAADLPSIQEIVTDGVHARLLPVGDVQAWTTALHGLIEDRNTAASLAAQARALAHSCTWQARADKLAASLGQVAQQPHKHALRPSSSPLGSGQPSCRE